MFASSSILNKKEKEELVCKQLEVKAETLVLMHGNPMHTSAANESRKSQLAFN